MISTPPSGPMPVPLWPAAMATCVRLHTPSLRMISRTWTFTVVCWTPYWNQYMYQKVTGETIEGSLLGFMRTPSSFDFPQPDERTGCEVPR